MPVPSQGQSREPISVEANQTKTIAVSPLEAFIQIPRKMKLPGDGFKTAFTDRLGSLGYASAEAGNKTPPRMILGGRLTAFVCEEKEGSPHLQVCGVSVAWGLGDGWRGGEVYRAETRARLELSINPAHLEGDIQSLFLGALDALLARPRFAEVMAARPGESPRPSEARTPDKAPMGRFARCAAKKVALPRNIETSMEATLLLRHGAVTGSAFYISSDGLALTAHHVVAGVERLKARDHFGNTFTARVLRKDARHDVALIQVDTEKSQCLSFREGLPRVGEELYAIGSPGGEELAFTVSRGIVSGIRTWKDHKFIQTDASVNAGNSGGPLLDADGRVVGVTAWKVVFPGFEGLGFGVPVVAAFERLAIRPGDKTSLNVTPLERDKKAPIEVVEDDPDPPFEDLPVAVTTHPRPPLVGFEPRYLYSSGRKFMLIVSPILMAGGTAVANFASMAYKIKVERRENDLLFSDDVDPVTGEPLDKTARLSPQERSRLVAFNIAGWTAAVAGTAMFAAFFSTPRDEIRGDDPPEPGTSARRDPALRWRVAFVGNAGLLTGTF